MRTATIKPKRSKHVKTVCSTYSRGYEKSRSAIVKLSETTDKSQIATRTMTAHSVCADVSTMEAEIDVDELITALHDKSPKVRRSAAETFGELEDARAVEPVAHALKDSDADVRLSVALAMGMIGDARATASLTFALKDEQDEAVRGAIEIALDMIKKKVMDKKMRLF